ncbi:5-formyltetrahydrofolate cyclo-ligase [Mediterraneibacter agrestimuris]|uniref:5-formyltetrahydrofolate cyclo-ligase n=1 Tax=Mediterraneibacter agrestimuris TaxID=2941333 RepID=UPI002040370B|nr:5-formyltetrahydrofolate cyclo-ligase [Mediterraneibacter agrestimuris]
METKREIRKNALERRKALPLDIRREYSHIITERVLCHPFFQCADIVFCYVTFREEVDTKDIIHSALKMGKTVAIPKVLGENHMEFYKISSMNDLTPGYQGILEPNTEHLQDRIIPISPEEVDTGRNMEKLPVILLPGSAFDKAGRRIGYGGGFYDTYLYTYPRFRKIGLAFSTQCVDEIPVEEHDVGVDVVVTEQGVLRKGEVHADRTAE